MANDNDLLLVTKVLQGDRNAFAAIVDNHKDMAVSIAFNILLNQEDAEEVAQDSFVKAFKALAAFKGQSKFSTWFYRIIINTALNKKKGKKQQTIFLEESVYENLPAENDNLLSKAIRKQSKEQILTALSELSNSERICISLYYLEELSVEEIHEVSAISVSNIKVLLHRARKRLFTILQLQLKNEITDLI